MGYKKKGQASAAARRSGSRKAGCDSSRLLVADVPTPFGWQSCLVLPARADWVRALRKTVSRELKIEIKQKLSL